MHVVWRGKAGELVTLGLHAVILVQSGIRFGTQGLTDSIEVVGCSWEIEGGENLAALVIHSHNAGSSGGVPGCWGWDHRELDHQPSTTYEGCGSIELRHCTSSVVTNCFQGAGWIMGTWW